MPQPYNYYTPQTSPFIAGLQGFEASQAQRQRMQEIAAEQAKAQRQKQYQQDMATLAQNPMANAEDYIKLQGTYPEKAAGIKEFMANRSDVQIKNDVGVVQRIISALNADKPQVAKDVMAEYQQALANSGRENEVQSIDVISDMVDSQPGAVKSELYNYILALQGPDKFKEIYNQTQGAAKTQKSEILPDGTSIIVDSAGNVTVKDAANNVLSGEDASKAIMKAKDYGVELAKNITYSREEGKWSGQKGRRAEVEGEVVEEKTKKGAQEKRFATIIDNGLTAAESVPSINRALELLNSVKTGGFQYAANRAKQVLGIESGDEAELNNKLSTEVLRALKPTFGAAFTVEEGKRLERISAGFGKSTEGNIRILKQLLKEYRRKARRARLAAERRDDMETVDEIDEWLNATESIGAEETTGQPAQEESTADLFKQLQNTLGQ